MKRLFEPSLVRRVMLALLLAFGLAWLVLLGFEYLQEGTPSAVDGKLASLASGLSADLLEVSDPAEARATVAILERTINRSYREAGFPAVFLVQLQDQSGQRLHGAAAWAEALANAPTGASHVQIPGHLPLHAYRVAGSRWMVTVAQSEVPRVWTLKGLAAELTVYMAIALPCLLLPLWLAVSQGLRPLRRLSQAVAERNFADLNATGLVARHRELRPLVSAIDDLLARLRAKVGREHAFIHDAAHELRTPMAVISAEAHAIAQAPDAVARSQAGERLDASLARAARLVDQLLALARMDDSHLPRHERVDVCLLVQQELAQVAPRAIAGGLALDLDAPDSLPLETEPLAVRTILRNLVDNALLYVPRGGRVHVSVALRGDALHLAVSDDGPGISPEDRERVFERFVRGAGHDVAGSGLGLAIVRQAALRMGGAVVLSDGLNGRGCRFDVHLRARGAVPAG